MEAFAWPGVVVVLVFGVMFRRQIRGLIDPTRQLSYKGWETYEPSQLTPPEDPTAELEEFMASFSNPLFLDQQRIINADLEGRGLNDPGMARAALLRSLAGSYILRHFERAQNAIWGSQTALLTALNGRSDGMTTEEAQAFYETGKSEFLKRYTEYAFDAWLWFLQSRWFVDTEEERLMITLTGSEFLKWRLGEGGVGPNVG